MYCISRTRDTRRVLGTFERYVRGAKYRNMLSPYFAPPIRLICDILLSIIVHYRFHALSLFLAHTRLAIRKHLPWKLVKSSDCVPNGTHDPHPPSLYANFSRFDRCAVAPFDKFSMI